jgi:hypothetical protein
MKLVTCVALGVALMAAGCSRIMGTTPTHEPIPDYPDGPAGLQQLFTDVLNAARNDDRDRAHDLFGTLKMTPAELQALFGARAASLQMPYDDMMATLINRGAVELVGMVYEKKYDTVEVGTMELGPEVGPASAEDQAIALALQQRPPLYFVRLRRAADTMGTRYGFFLYRDGKWRTGNFLGKVLAKQDAQLTEAPPAR